MVPRTFFEKAEQFLGNSCLCDCLEELDEIIRQGIFDFLSIRTISLVNQLEDISEIRLRTGVEFATKAHATEDCRKGKQDQDEDGYYYAKDRHSFRRIP